MSVVDTASTAAAAPKLELLSLLGGAQHKLIGVALSLYILLAIFSLYMSTTRPDYCSSALHDMSRSLLPRRFCLISPVALPLPAEIAERCAFAHGKNELKYRTLREM